MSAPLPRRVHLVGAGGSGMAALGHVLLDLGTVVSGSDRKESATLELLRARGAAIRGGEAAAVDRAVGADVELLVRSAAVPDSDPEVKDALRRGIEVLWYAQALGRVMAGRDGVAIAGTHGKTTTTAMIATALGAAGAGPGYLIGGDVPGLGRSGAGGGAGPFVAEACEFAGSFLELSYRVAAVTNVEADHLDWYGTFAAVVAAFREFLARVRPGGAVALTRAAADVLGPLSTPAATVLTVALEGAADVRAADLAFDRGAASFRIEGAFATRRIRLEPPGRHVAEDALLAAAVLHLCGLDGDAIAAGLERFSGVGRRLERIVDGPVALLSDYAHHPTELAAAHDALRARFPGRRLVAAFQPHQARRTRDFFADFAAVLARFDRVVLADIYRAREGDDAGGSVSSELLAAAVVAAGGSARAAGNLAAVERAIRAEARPSDVVVLFGAGDIDELRGPLESALSQQHGRGAGAADDVSHGRQQPAPGRAADGS